MHVVVDGSQQGSITNIDGNYRINVSVGSTLRFSYIGYIDQEIQVGNQSVIDVEMETDVTQLNEVVVTAFGIEKDKKSLGYAVQKVDGEDISAVKATPRAVSNLKWRIAGVNITESGSGPGAGVRVIIRGNNSLTQDNQPLFVVDGIPMDNTNINEGCSVYNSGNAGFGISDINPADIEYMTVLEGPNATALCGCRQQRVSL